MESEKVVLWLLSRYLNYNTCNREEQNCPYKGTELCNSCENKRIVRDEINNLMNKIENHSDETLNMILEYIRSTHVVHRTAYYCFKCILMQVLCTVTTCETCKQIMKEETCPIFPPDLNIFAASLFHGIEERCYLPPSFEVSEKEILDMIKQ